MPTRKADKQTNGQAESSLEQDKRRISRCRMLCAWKIRSWYQVSPRDHASQPDGERGMAKRMGADVLALENSHPAMVPHPQAIVNLVKKAAKAVT